MTPTTPKPLSVVALPGFHLDTLGYYFAALGLLRLSARRWPQVKGCWRNGIFNLIGGPADIAALENILLSIGQNREWTPYAKSWDAFQKKDTSAQCAENSTLWRAQQASELEVLHFQSHIATAARLSFNPVFGTGGNAGARLFAKGWSSACDAIAPKNKKFPRGITAEVIARDLSAFLVGGSCSYLSDFGAACWFSAANKMFNNGLARSFRGGQITPWAMLLACEAFPLLAGATSRQIGFNRKATGAFPFVTRGPSPEAEQEAGKNVGEFWAPVWQHPLSLHETAALIQRGRAEVNGHGAITAAAFAAAIIQKGTDAGLSEFRRFSLQRTTSENTFESRLASIHPLNDHNDADQALAVSHVIQLRDALPRDSKKVYRGVQGPVDQALIRLAEVGNRDDLRRERSWELVDAMFAALGKVDRNKTFRAEEIRFKLLPPAWAASLLSGGHDNTTEARIALALATLLAAPIPRSRRATTTRRSTLPAALLSYRLGAEVHQRGWQIPSNVPFRRVWAQRAIEENLIAVIQRRLSAESDTKSHPPFETQAAFTLSAHDTAAFIHGETDDELLARWLDRFLLFDWSFVAALERNAFVQFLRSVPNTAIPTATPELCLHGLLRPLFDRGTFDVVRDRAVTKPAGHSAPPSPQSGSLRRVVALLERHETGAAQQTSVSIYQGLVVPIANFGNNTFECEHPKRLLASLILPTSPAAIADLFARWKTPSKTRAAIGQQPLLRPATNSIH